MQDRFSRRTFLIASAGIAAGAGMPGSSARGWHADDPLLSWNEGAAKAAIRDFVARVTTAGSPAFVPTAERIATFDNDGTLWCEQPLYVQAMFCVDRIKTMVKDDPSLAEKPAFRAVLDRDLKSLAALGEAGIADVVATTHGGMDTEAFSALVRDWLATARHPRFQCPYTELTYRPMVELLDFLRANRFRTFIVTGGGVEFVRAISEASYGIPPEQVIGSTIALKYETEGDTPRIVREPKITFVDDGPGKPVGIQSRIGRRPIAAFGNSDGDYDMLRYTTSAPGARLGVIVHHTDADREYAYDRDTHVGKLARALDEAPAQGWLVVDMKRDWNRIFHGG